MTPSVRWLPRLTAFGFAAGCVEHTIQAARSLSAAGFRPHAMPSWRHPQMAVVDALIVLVALRYPKALVFCLLAFLAEQWMTHGQWVLNEWNAHRQIPRQLAIVDGLVFLATIGAGFVRWHRPNRGVHGP